MSGRDAIRGFAVQTLLCLLDSLDGANSDWAAVTIEPDSDNEKVDILWEFPTFRKAQQIKSSRNVMGRVVIERWCADLAASKAADRYELLLAGPVAAGVIAAAPFSGVDVPPSVHVDLASLIEQAVTRVDRYLTAKLITAVPLGIREMLVTLLAGKLTEGATAGQRWDREVFNGHLLRWTLAAYPTAIQYRLQANCEVMWSEAFLITPRRAEQRAYDVALPLGVVNGGPAVAVVEWFTLRVSQSEGSWSILYRPVSLVRDTATFTNDSSLMALATAGFGEFAVLPNGLREQIVLFTPDASSTTSNEFWALGALTLSLHVKYRGLPAPRLIKILSFQSIEDHRSALGASAKVRLEFCEIGF